MRDLGADAIHERLEQTALHRLLQLRVVRVTPEPVVVEMPVQPDAFNSSGNLHGGAIATLVDVAGGTAAAMGSSFVPGVNTIVTADLHVRYLGRAKGSVVRAEGRVLRAGRQLVVVEVQVKDDDGGLIAVADFSSMIVPLRATLRPEGPGDPKTPDL